MAVYLQDVDKGKKKKEEEKKTSAPPKSISVPSVSTPSASIPSASPVTQPAQRQTTSGPPVAVSAIEATAWKQQQDYLDALYRNAYTQYIPNSHAAELNQNMMEQGLAPIYTSNQAAKPFNAADYYDHLATVYTNKSLTLARENGASSRRQRKRAEMELADLQFRAPSEPENDALFDRISELENFLSDYDQNYQKYKGQRNLLNAQIEQAKKKAEFARTVPDQAKQYLERMAIASDESNQYGVIEFVEAGARGASGEGFSSVNQVRNREHADKQRDAEDARQALYDMGYTNDEVNDMFSVYKGIRNDEIANKNAAYAAKDAADFPILTSIFSVPLGLIGNVLGTVGMFAAPGERNNPTFTGLSSYANTVQSTVQANIENSVREKIEEPSIANFFAKVAGYGYAGATSAAESALAMGLGAAAGAPWLGEALLGVGAASQTYNDMLTKGYSYEDALTSGVVSGLIETLTEHVSLENLKWLKASGGGLKNLPINLVKSFVTEGSEEIASDLLNEAWDYFAHGGMSEYYDFVTRYLEEHRGATEAEARSAYAKQFGEQLLESGIIGGFSGMLGAGWTGTANSVRGGIFSNIEGRETGNVYQNVYQRMLQEQARGNTEANPATAYNDLLETAMSLPEGSKARQNLVNMQESFQSESPTKRQVRQQGKAINAALTELNQTEEGREAASKYQYNLAVQNWAATGTSDEVVDKSILTRYGVTDETMKKAVDEKKGITAEKIVAIDNGVATVQTSDGRTVRANEAQFKSRDQAALYLAAPKLGYNASTTNDIIQQIDSTRDVPVLQQMLALDDAVRYGKAGTQLTNEIMQDNTLTTEQLTGAYTIGRGLTEIATRQRQNLLQQARERMVTQQKITVDGKTETINTVGGLTVDSLNESQKVQAGALMHLAKAVTKNKIVLYASELNEDGQRVVKTDIPAIGVAAGDLAPNAAYDRATGDIYVDINAGQSGQGLMLFHASHEFGHYIKQWNPAKFLAMQDFLVKEVYGDKLAADLIRDQMDKANANGRTLTQEEAAEEMVADALQEMLTRGDVMEKIAKLKQQDRSLWQKLKDFITDMAKRIRAIYKGVDPESREAQELRKAGDAIQKLADMFAKGLVEAGENFEAIGNARAVVELNASEKFSSRDASYLKAVEDGDMETAQRMVDEAAKAAFPDTILKKKNGILTKVWHGTTSKFNVFKKGDIGFHFGNKGTATTRVGKGKNTRLIAAYIDITNPIYFDEDLGSWDADYRLARELYEKRIISAEELRSVLITDSGNYKRSTGNANIKLREILVNKGYDGIVYKNWHESNGSDSYIVFNSSQIKSADPVTYDDAGNVIPLSERFNAEERDIRYSDREASGTDARTLLSNALMDVTQNDDERKLLTKYQSEIAKRNAEEAKLNETRREIRDMMFRKGPRDEAYKKKLTDLKIEAQKSANRLSSYDKRLLDLEATKHLKNVLAAERQNAIEKERARSVKLEMDLIKAAGKESNELRKQLKRQKDASDRKIARLEEDIEHRKEMRQKGIDQRASTDLRGRIKSIQKDLQDRLQHGNLHKSVPRALAQSVVDICIAIDPTGEDQNSKAAKRFRDTRDALLQLRAVYDTVDTTDTSGFTDDFRAGFSKAINDLAAEIGKTPLRDMSREQLEMVLLVLQQVRHIIVNTNKLLGIQRGMDVDEMKQNIRDNMDEVRRKGLNHGRTSDNAFARAGGNVLNWEMRWFVNPLRMVREVTGYDNDAELYRLMNDINEGRKKGAFWEMTARKLFAPLTEGKENRKAYLNAAQKTFDFELKDMDGNELKMSKMQAMTLLLTYEREQQNKDRKHLESPTYIPSVNELRKGNWEKANELAQEMPVMDEKALQKLRDGTSDEWCQRYMEAARKVFNEMSNTALNEVSMELIGRPIATEKAYIPYEVNDDFIKGTDENVTFDRNILNAGFTKEVKKNAPQPLVIRGLNDVLDRHIRGVATYYGTAIPVYNWNKVFGAAEYSSTPVRQAVTQAWGKKTVQALRRAVADAQGPRHGDTLPLFGRIKSNWVQATLAFNISVWMKQAASYPTAGAYLSAKALAKGLPYFGKSLSEKQRQAIYDEIDKYTAENYMRRTGMEGTQEMAEFSQQKGRIKQASDALGNISPLNWIQSMDIRTTAALWVACKAQVEQDGTRPDADDYWQNVTDLYEAVIENTQPMYDPMHRAEIAKNKVAQNFIVFQTQPIQNSGILREAYFERKAAVKQFGKDSAELKAANRKFMKACTSQLASHMVFALMTAVAAAALHRVDPWRDDDDELTFGSAVTKYGTDVLNAVVGAVFPVVGSYAMSLLDNVISGHGYDILSDPVVDQVNSLITSIQNLKDPSYKTVSNAITTVLAMFGVPAANAQRVGEAIFRHAEDIINGHAFTFEAGVSRTTAQERNRLYDALVSGDQAKVGEIKATFKTEEEYHKAVRQTLTEHDDRIQSAVEARQDMDMQSYTSILNEIIGEGVFSRDDVLQAAESANSAYNSAVKAAYTAQQEGDEKAFQQKVADIVAKGYDEEAFRQAVKDYVPKQTDGEDEDKEVQWLSASDTKAFLYKALLENDTSTVAILKQAFDTEKKYHNAIVSALKENDPRIREAAEARLKGDSSEYLRITKQIIAEKHFTQDDIVKAVNGVMSSIKSGAEEDENATVTPWWEDESESGTSFGFKKADLQNAFASGDRQDIELVISEITADAVAKGKTQEDAQSSAESTVASALKDLYLNDGIDAAGVKTYLKRYSGDDDNDVYWILDNWDYAKENGKDASYGKYLKFYEAVQTGKNLKSEVQRYLTHGVKKETLASQITSYFKPIYKDMNNTQRAALKGYLLNAYAALGYNRYKKSKDIDKWLKS